MRTDMTTEAGLHASADTRANVRTIDRVLRYAWALPNTAVGALLLPLAAFGGGVRLVEGVLEAHGPLIARILRHCVPIPGGASAITFGHIVLGRDAEALMATRSHERVHVRQCERWGPLFIPAYLVMSVAVWIAGRDAYTDNYFERQAYANSSVGAVVARR